jgi:outer membrane receptor protein involved in Fe transport
MPAKKTIKPMLNIIALLPFAFSALAQEVAQAVNKTEEGNHGLEVIEVTAQKRVTSLQDTPIAISAFSRTMLDDQNIEDALDIQFGVPNLTVPGNGGYSVRGVGNTAISATADPGLGVHVNGVYVRSGAIQNEYYDLESIEVLRGPQGTLFGRNTTSGVLNSITRRPDDIFEAQLTTEIATFNSLRTKGFVNIPLSESVLQRFAFNTVKRDGYTENLAENVGFDELDGRDQWSLRSSTTFEFSEKATGFLFAEYFQENSDRSVVTGVLCQSDPILGCDNSETLSSEFPNTSHTDGALANGGLSGLLGSVGFGLRDNFYNTNLDGSARSNPSDPRQVRMDTQPKYYRDDLLVSFEFNYEFGDYVFTSVSAYHDREGDAERDFDSADGADGMLTAQALLLPSGRTEPTTRHSTVRTDHAASTQKSQEFRVASYLNGPFNFTAGAYYFDYDGESLVNFYIPELTGLAGFLGLPDELAYFSFQSPSVTTTSWAIFSEAYYDFSEDLKLTFGLRYTDEEKGVVTRQVSPLSYLNPAFDLEGAIVEGENDWQEVTGKIGLSYSADFDMTDETLFFGTLSRGYKGGGINPGGSGDFPTFDPEYINSFEVGTKNTFAGRKFQANVTAFIYQYDGLQVGGILGDGTTFNTNVDADVKGAEFEFVAAPVDGLRINLNLSLLDSEINEDFFTSPDISSPSGSGPVNLKGKTLQFSPESSIQFGIQYTHALAENWEIAYRAQTYWQDEYYSRLYNIATDLQDSWQQTDLSVTVRDLDNVWEFEAFIKNAGDEASITSLGVDNSIVGRYRTPVYLDPRTYGVRVTYRFE